MLTKNPAKPLLPPPISRVWDRFYPTQFPLRPPLRPTLPIPVIPTNILESQTDFTLLSSLSSPHCLSQLPPPTSRVSDRFYPTQFPLPPPLPIPAIPANISSLRPILSYSVPSPAPTAYPCYPRQYLESQTDFTLFISLSGPHCLSQLSPPISRVSDRFYSTQFPLRPPLPIPATPVNISSLRPILPYSVASPPPSAYPSYPRKYLESQTDFTLLSSLSGPHCLS